MADWRVRVMAMAVTAGWAAVACGSRTGDYLGPGYDDGAGFGPGAGVEGFGGSTDGSGGNTQASSAVVTTGFVGITASGVGATFGMGFSASGTTGPSSFVSGAGGFVGFTAVSGFAFGSSTVSTGVTGVGGAGSSCCDESSGPGCEEPEVMACVCSADPFCCKYLWDGFCVQEVEQLGCGSCDGAVGGTGGAMQSAVTTGTSSSAGGAMQSAVTGMQSAVTGMGSVVSVATGIGGASSSSTTGEGGAGGVAECIAQSKTDCEACLCGDCFQAYGDCVGDFGCPRILECMDSTGCTGIDCYAPDTCQQVIDRFGGPMGASIGYVTGLVECAVAADCPCQ
ncbi:MAG TPA: hypothetical protein VI197_07770 [Polyangiaceae bacterium]